MDGQLSNKIIKDWVHLLILTYSCKKSRVTSNSSFSFFHMPSILPQSNPSTVKTFLLPAHILPPWLLKLFLSALLISSHLNHYNSSKCSPDFNFWGGGMEEQYWFLLVIPGLDKFWNMLQWTLKRKRTVEIVEQRWKCGMEIIRGLHNPFGSGVLILALFILDT